nr:uncharacterized protein LOC106732240 [Pelodiscus sinensis]|eukprot:XP_014430686.1 uncharacterized protein LOC106732240 [Pelodiscus sinensis]
MAMLQFLQQFVQAAFLALHKVNNKLITETFSLCALATAPHSGEMLFEAGHEFQQVGAGWSWRGGAISSDSKTSACGRPPLSSCVPGLPLSSDDGTLTWRSGSPSASGSLPPHTATRQWANSSSWGSPPLGPSSWRLRAINSILLHRVIHLGDLDPIAAGFATLGFSSCVGVIDGTHISICAQYINRKGYFSMVLQALVDHRGQFTDIFIRWWGRMTNAPRI